MDNWEVTWTFFCPSVAPLAKCLPGYFHYPWLCYKSSGFLFLAKHSDSFIFFHIINLPLNCRTALYIPRFLKLKHFDLMTLILLSRKNAFVFNLAPPKKPPSPHPLPCSVFQLRNHPNIPHSPPAGPSTTPLLSLILLFFSSSAASVRVPIRRPSMMSKFNFWCTTLILGDTNFS